MRRSIAEQSDAELGGSLSVLVRQKRDHVRLDRLLGDLRGAEGEAEEQALRHVMRLVFSHAFAEEALLWPVIRRALPDGDALTLQVEREHQDINELAVQLETTTVAGATGRSDLIDRMVALLREDVRDEEDVLLPRLQQALSTAQLRLLGVQWELIRRTAPTRPHPDVARRPPGNVLAAVPLTMLDRARDALDRVARRRRGTSAGSASRSAGQMLAAISERVERARFLRAGEHPGTRTRAAGGHGG